MTHDRQGFGDRVLHASKDARARYRTAELVGEGEVARLIRTFAALAPAMLKEAAEASDGLLRFQAGKFGGYQNDHYSLRLGRPDLRVYSLHLIFIRESRVTCYIKDGAEPSHGTNPWLDLQELREPESFLEAKIFELINYYYRDAGTLS